MSDEPEAVDWHGVASDLAPATLAEWEAVVARHTRLTLISQADAGPAQTGTVVRTGHVPASAALLRSIPTPTYDDDEFLDDDRLVIPQPEFVQRDPMRRPRTPRATATPTPDATDAAYPENRVSYWKALWETAMSTIDRLERQAAIRPDATDAGSREAVMALVIDDFAPAAGLIERRGFELAIKAVLDILKSPSTPTTEGLDVERLATALTIIDLSRAAGAYPHLGRPRDRLRFAVELAAEYQRLSEPE